MGKNVKGWVWSAPIAYKLARPPIRLDEENGDCQVDESWAQLWKWLVGPPEGIPEGYAFSLQPVNIDGKLTLGIVLTRMNDEEKQVEVQTAFVVPVDSTAIQIYVPPNCDDLTTSNNNDAANNIH